MTTVIWPHRTRPMANINSTGETVGGGEETQVRGESRAGSLRIVMAGGGTGGHLYPGLAVAEALRARTEQAGRELELVWAATPRAVDQRLLSRFGDRYIRQPVQPLLKSLGKWWAFWTGWRQSCAFWAAYLNEHGVDCVVAMGGYAAGPAAYIAAKRRIPVVLLNPDAIPGRANRFLLKRADVIVTQWALGKEYEGKIRGRVKPLGCPIRAELTARTREEGAAILGTDPLCRTLVVTGASLGAKTINDAMVALLEDAEVRKAFEGDGRSNWQIMHLAGLDQAEATRAAYARFPKVRAKLLDYCDDMASLWAIADLAIARAGASTCAELTACGVPSILLPYPFHKDMHQRANAQQLANGGAALIIDDAKDAGGNAAAVKTALLSLLYDDDRRVEMAQAAQAAGKPAAAEHIAAEILDLIAASSR